ncbi:MAG: LysR family transcriptional regulator [Granulosicoccus sp.]|nr:LysR family transcriptional regulator [Granulosicoccus sp.]
MHIKLRQLEVFSALIASGSVSGAAAQLSLTQPAVSIALSNLEKAVGFRLFDRTRGFFAPTAEAILLHTETEQCLLALSRIERCAQDISAGKAGSITIASNGAAAINLLPLLIADFRQIHPNIHIDLKIRSSRQIASWVSGRHVDIGLIDAPVPVDGLDVTLFRIPCVCIMQEDENIAKLDVVTPQALEGKSVIGVTGEHEIDRELDRLLAEANVLAERNLTASYFAIMRNLVREGAGVALVDAINGRMGLTDKVTWRPFNPAIHYDLALLTARDQVSSKPVDLFMQQLCDRLEVYTGGDLPALPH